jgi:hypothetical protein
MGASSLVASIMVYCVAALLTALGVGPCLARDMTHLQESDCIKCHSYEHAVLQSKGGKHGTEVACIDCHAEHPPHGVETIAPCSRCHSGTPHLKLENCDQCHSHAHMPMLSLQFPGNARIECMTCHEKQGREVTEFASRHGQLACVSCHPSHDMIPDCLDCHAPHVNGQVMMDCRHCHPTHHPRQIVPPSYASVSFCKPCHIDVIKNLQHTTTNHGILRCTYCHKGLHPPKAIRCQDCHGLPHGWEILRKHKSCLSCHGDPHLLV